MTPDVERVRRCRLHMLTHQLVVQAPEQENQKNKKVQKQKEKNKNCHVRILFSSTKWMYWMSLLHCPGGTHHKPAMTRSGGRACLVRSAAVRGPRWEVTSCLRRCRDTYSSPASLWPPSSRLCRRSWSPRSASPSACGTTAAGSLRTPGLQGETVVVHCCSHGWRLETELHSAGRK